MLPIWLTEKVYFNGDDYFQEMIQDLDRAAYWITLEMYIFNLDALGEKLITQLIKAQARGVKVELIIDGIGSMSLSSELNRRYPCHGLRIKTYNPLPFYHPFYGQLTMARKFQIYSLRFSRLNNRNHRKIITIDEGIMYTGSFNITAEHTSSIERPWKDMGVRVTGSLVKYAVLNFKRNLKLREYYLYKKQNKPSLDFNWRQSPLHLNQTLMMRRYYQRDFFKRIFNAQTRIWIIAPYFIPHRKLIRALGKAAARGVDVQILSSFRSDVPLFRTLQYFYYPYLLQKGVKVFQYTDTVLHAKNYIIDDWTTIGTTNLNHRSLMHDLEVDLVVQDKDNIQAVINHFQLLTDGQRPLTLEELRNRPLLDRFLGRLFFLFKYWF